MSVVGPRPERVEHVRQYTAEIPEGAEAEIELPGEAPVSAGGGAYTFERPLPAAGDAPKS